MYIFLKLFIFLHFCEGLSFFFSAQELSFSNLEPIFANSPLFFNLCVIHCAEWSTLVIMAPQQYLSQ